MCHISNRWLISRCSETHFRIPLCLSVTSVPMLSPRAYRNIMQRMNPSFSMALLLPTSLLCNIKYMHEYILHLFKLNSSMSSMVYITLTCTSSVCRTWFLSRSIMVYDPNLAEKPGVSARPSPPRLT